MAYPRLQFYYEPKIFVALAESTNSAPRLWKVVGKAKDAREAIVDLPEWVVPLCTADFDKAQQLAYQRTHSGSSDREEPCQILSDAVDTYYYTATDAPPFVFIGSALGSKPSLREAEAWLTRNVADPTMIERPLFYRFLKSRRYPFYVPNTNAPLAQHALAVAHFDAAGTDWLAQQDSAFAGWNECTPKTQLVVRLLKAQMAGRTRLLDPIRRYLRLPKDSDRELVNADMLRVVHVNFEDHRPETTLLNLFLAHFDAA